MRPGAAVWTAPAWPFELEDEAPPAAEVTLLAADEALELAPAAALLAADEMDAMLLDAPARMEEPLCEAPDARDDTADAFDDEADSEEDTEEDEADADEADAAPAPPPKIVVDPTVVVPVVEPAELVSALTIAEVLTAELEPGWEHVSRLASVVDISTYS